MFSQGYTVNGAMCAYAHACDDSGAPVCAPVGVCQTFTFFRLYAFCDFGRHYAGGT